MWYNYEEHIKEDIEEEIKYRLSEHDNYKDFIEHFNKCKNSEELVDFLEDSFWAEDRVTGNGGDGVYFIWDEDAMKAVSDNWGLACEMAKDYDVHLEALTLAHIDVAIRCYLLRDCIEKVVKENYRND